jgi:hypothetical protein
MLDTAAPIARPGARRSRHVAHASAARADAHTTHASRTLPADVARASPRSTRRGGHVAADARVRVHHCTGARGGRHRRRDFAHGSGCARIRPLGHPTAAPSGSSALSSRSVADPGGSGHRAGTKPTSPPWTSRLRDPIRAVPTPSGAGSRRPRRRPARGHGLPNQPPGPRPRTDTASAPSASRSSRCSPVYWMPTTRIVPPGFTTRCICPMAVRRSSRSLMLRIATLAVTSPKVWSDIGREVMSAVSTSIRSATPFATASARVRSAGRASRCRPSRSRPGGRASRRNVLREMERGLRQERQPDDKPTDPTAVRRGHRREPGREERDERDGEQGRPGPDVTKAQVGDLGLRV